MNDFEKELILKTLKRCNGLQLALSSDKSDVRLQALISLAYESGFRYSFVKNNLEEIKKL